MHTCMHAHMYACDDTPDYRATLQGEHIDNILTNIETTHTNTTKGVNELTRAS